MLIQNQNLTKRTNILFDEDLFNYLKEFAKKRHTSVGALVRLAIEKTYLVQERDKQNKKLHALSSIKNIKKNIKKPITKADIKKFIEYGRS